MDFTRSRLPGVFAAQSVLSSQTGLEWGIFSNPRQRQPHEQHPSVVMPSFVSIMSIYLRLHERPDFLSPKHMLINMYWSGNKPVIGVGHHFRVYGCPLSALNLAPDKGLGNFPTGTEVLCIKVPNRSHETNRHDLYQAVLRELRVLCHPSLSNHENIISLLGFDFEQDYDDPQVAWPVLVMECSEYGTLHDFQQNAKDMTPDLLRQLLLDVALGLDTLHQCNIIHGDMKSENVLICRNGCRDFVAKLSDFGLAVINPAVDDVHFLPGGTWLWSAPEAKQRLSIVGLALTDVYSLGLMVWRSLLSEANPFDLLRSEHENVHGALGLEEFVTQAKSGEDFPEFAVCAILSSARKDMAMSYGGKVIRSTVCKDPANRDLKAAISALSNEDGYVLNLIALEEIIEKANETYKREVENIVPNVEYWDLEDPHKILVNLDIWENLDNQFSYRMMNQCAWRTMLQELASLLDSDSEIAILACQLRFQFAIDPQFQAGKKEMDEASKWLVRACELGSKFHRGLAFRFHQVFDQPIPEEIAIEWLEDAAADGSSIAIESLQTHFPNRLLRLRQGLDSTFKIRAGCNLEHRGTVDLNPESPHLGTVPPTDHGTEFDQLFATINITTDMNQVNENAGFLLEHCRNGNYTECKRLLEKGVLVLHNDNSPSALHWLVSFQNEEQMEDIAVRLLGNGAVLNHWEDMDNVDILNGDIRGTPLHWAVWQRNTSAVRVLTKLDPDPQSENVDRAVLLAATLHFPDVLELLQHWITARRTSSYNVFPAVIMACMTGPFLIPRLLHRDSHCREADMLKAFCCLLTMGNLSKEERSSIVMCTILHNNSILLRYLLESLIPKERQDMIDTFWLYFVIEAGFYEAFEVLTEANIGLPHMNINALAGPALTALQVCAVTHQRNLAFATRLIEMGWPADARTPEVYYTPFCIALMNGMYDYANLLLQRGANKDILLGIGHGGRKTPAFILLTIWPETPISRLKYLLEYLPNHGYGHINFIGFPGLGANLLYPVAFNIWASYRSGRHMAEILKYILSMLHDRSCLNSLDRLGVSVIGIAAINGSAECCRILIEAGADVNAGLSRPLSSAQKRLKALRDEEQLNSGTGLAGERKLAADRCARAEETINLLERHGAQGNNFIGFNVNLWEKIAQGKFRPPSAELMFEMLAGAIDGSGWVDPASVVSLHPTKSSEFGISKSNKDKFIIRSRFGEVGRMVDNSVRSVIDFASENKARIFGGTQDISDSTTPKHSCHPWYPCRYAIVVRTPLVAPNAGGVHMLPTVQPLRPPIQSNVTPTNQFQSPLQHHGISAAALQRSELNYSSLMSPPNQNFVVPGVRFFQPHISTVNDISSASTAQHHTTQTHVPIHRSNSPQDVMLRLEASLSELADSEAEVRHRIQRAEEILRREFEAPIQLTNPCEYIDRCEDYQMIAHGVDVLLGLVGIELLGLVPELSESGRELRVHVSNTATCS